MTCQQTLKLVSTRRLLVPVFVAMLLAIADTSGADELRFGTTELKTKLRVGYAVRLIDMNDDKRLDIVVVDSKRIVWLENPNWKEHTLIQDDKRTDNVCFAPADIDGDGKLDFAIGRDWTVNTRKGGIISWIQNSGKIDKQWKEFPIGSEPTVHRMRFANIDHDKEPELIVLPLMGRNSTRPKFAETGVRVLAFDIPKNPLEKSWKPKVINDKLHVCHNFCATDLNDDGKQDLLVVSFEGVTLLEQPKKADGKWKSTLIGSGNQKTSPNRGASEIKHGKFAGNKDYIATIEPWHGHQVVIYTRPNKKKSKKLWNRHVIDESLKWGHAVWCANLDADEDQELIIGVRDNKDKKSFRGLRIYDPVDQTGKNWKRHIIDPDGVAIEDLAAADLNGDGRTDIVAVGRQTHNVKIYWNETK